MHLILCRKIYLIERKARHILLWTGGYNLLHYDTLGNVSTDRPPAGKDGKEVQRRILTLEYSLFYGKD